MMTRRRMLMSSKKKEVFPEGFVPVEYLESARDVRMDTGIIPSIDMSFCADFAVVSSENKTSVVFDSDYSWATGECVYLQVHGIWKWVRAQFSDATASTGGNVITNAKTNAAVNANGMFINGERICILSPSKTLSGYSSSIIIFRTSGMRLYGFECENDGGIVMDLVPGRIGQVGYMYDRVTGRMFGGSSGDFILGNDVK